MIMKSDSANDVKRVLVPVANGSEDLETAAIVDILRRARAEVTLASVNVITITGSRGIRILCDKSISACLATEFGIIVLPGGIPGSKNLRDSPELTGLLNTQVEKGRYFAGICAAPAVVLEYHGFLAGHFATCHPNFRHYLRDARLVDEPVVWSGNCVTAPGAGQAICFSLALVQILFGSSKATSVAFGLGVPFEKVSQRS